MEYIGPETPAEPVSERLGWQSTLRVILLWIFPIALAAAPLAFFGATSVGGAIAIAGIVVTILLRLRARTTIVELLVIVGVAGALISILQPVMPLVGSRAPARNAQCRNQLKQIAIALRMYHQEHGRFPPAYIADEHGRPLHSWRVLILPYIEDSDLYAKYHFDEPWDGPNNRLLHGQMPSIYQCPSAVDGLMNPRQHTNYLAVVGDETAWPGQRARSLDEFLDGTSNTILVVENHDSGIHWMEPRDLDWATTSTLVNVGPKGRCIGSDHTGGANVAFADGSIRWLSETTPGVTVGALVTVRRGESVDLDDR